MYTIGKRKHTENITQNVMIEVNASLVLLHMPREKNADASIAQRKYAICNTTTLKGITPSSTS